MKSLTALIIFVIGLGVASEEECNRTCPTWTMCDTQSQSCICGNLVENVVSCSISADNKSEVAVMFGFCLSMNNANTSMVVGPCPFNYKRYAHVWVYLDVPSNPWDVDGVVCGFTNRTGQLCGQCVDGYSPPVYSYYPQCVRCSLGTNNWPKYLAVSLLPTTIFFLTVTTVRFRAPSSILHGYILFSQVLTSPPIVRRLSEFIHKSHSENTPLGYSLKVLSAYFGIWNLDFFRLFYSPFCLYPNASTLQVLSLDYIIAVYPLLLIVFTYTLVTLHYKNCKLVVWLWRPFIGCFARCRRQWDIQNSLVDAFATFLLLSYVKLLHVSFDILAPAKVWNVNGKLQHPVLYNDGTVEYFSTKHIPYAVVAIIVLLVFILLPIFLLCLYPCRSFHKLLNRHHINSPALQKFMDTFQGYYKDGTSGTRDYRFFAALYLILRMIINGYLVISAENGILITIVMVFILLLFVLQTYKDKHNTNIDALFLMFIIAFLSSEWNMYDHNTVFIRTNNNIVIYIVLLVTMVYPVCVLIYYFHRRSETAISNREDATSGQETQKPRYIYIAL